MADARSYQFGPVLTDRIISVVKRVDSMPYQAGLSRIPTRFEEMPTPGQPLKRGTYTGSWAIGTTAAVTLIGSTQTIAVTNYCVEAVRSTSVSASMNVVFGSIQGTHTAVEVEVKSVMRLGKTTAQWNKNSLATITLYDGGTGNSESAAGGTLQDVVNKFGNVPANKWVAVMRGPTGSYYLIAAEC